MFLQNVFLTWLYLSRASWKEVGSTPVTGQRYTQSNWFWMQDRSQNQTKLQLIFWRALLGWGLIGYVKSEPLRSGQIISIDVLVVVMIIAVFHEKLIWPPVRAISKLKRHLLDLTLWTTVLWAIWTIDRWRHHLFWPQQSVKTDVAPSINCSYRPQNCSSESELQQMALQFWNGRWGGSNQLFLKNGYDHHEHQDI